MNLPHPEIRVAVDPTNPGEFFACCGLLELATRLWPSAEGWFDRDGRTFNIAAEGASLDELRRQIIAAPLHQIDANDDFSSPIALAAPFDLRLDWWIDERANGKPLKVWAGSMRSVRIARAMRAAIGDSRLVADHLFEFGTVVPDPDEPSKKVEPFYFDSRRGTNAMALDVGFSPDALGMTTIAFPAVEFLCLVGLQRCRPMPTSTPRIFEYSTWSVPLGISVVPAVLCGFAAIPGNRFRFENAFRTDQKKHKAFLPAVSIGDI